MNQILFKGTYNKTDVALTAILQSYKASADFFTCSNIPDNPRHNVGTTPRKHTEHPHPLIPPPLPPSYPTPPKPPPSHSTLLPTHLYVSSVFYLLSSIFYLLSSIFHLLSSVFYLRSSPCLWLLRHLTLTSFSDLCLYSIAFLMFFCFILNFFSWHVWVCRGVDLHPWSEQPVRHQRSFAHLHLQRLPHCGWPDGDMWQCHGAVTCAHGICQVSGQAWVHPMSHCCTHVIS